MKPKYFYVLVSWAKAVFVKEEYFFVQQGGLTQKWGRNWKPIQANSIEHARELAHENWEQFISEEQDKLRKTHGVK